MSHNLPATRVVVLGEGITALGVVRSLGRAGLDPYLACPPGDIAGASRYAKKRLLTIRESEDPAALVAQLGDVGLHEAVLFPSSDLWAQAVSRLPDDARARYPSSTPRADVLDVLVDKVRFAQTLERLEVPHPRTQVIDDVRDLERADLSGCFLKPGHSQRFNRVSAVKAISFDTPDEARAGVACMAAAGVDALLQEYIPGPPSCHYFVDGFVDAGGTVRALFARRRLRMYPPDYGNSTLMVTVSLSSVEGAVHGLQRLLGEIGFRGIFSAEFKQDPRDGVFRLLEVNARPWWYIGFAAQCGVDVTMLAYRDALGMPVESVTGYPVGARCVLLHLDLRAFLHERGTSGLGAFTWARSVIGAKPSVFSWHDPLPGVELPLVVARRRLRHRRAAADPVDPAEITHGD